MAPRILGSPAIAALLLAAAASCVFAWNQNADGSNPTLGLKWSRIPIPYRINPSTPFGNVTAGALTAADAARAAFGTWAAVASANLAFNDQGSTDLAVPPNIDGVNIVSFADDTFPYNGALAVTPYSYDVQSGTIRYASVLLNPQVRFTTGAEAGAYDLQAVATHEIGHLLGLDHSAILASTMLAFAVRDNRRGRTLAPDDVAAISSVYPSIRFKGSVGSISGRASGGAGTPLFGAHALAVNAAGVAVCGAYTRSNGAYTIAGLPPALYQVWLEPLDGPVTTSNLASPAYAANAPLLSTDFGTTSFGGSLSVQVSAGLDSPGIDFVAPAKTATFDLRRLAVVPSGTAGFDPASAAADAAAATPNQELIVAGPGVDGSVQFSISGQDVQLTPLSTLSLSDGTPAARLRVSIAATAALGARNVVATSAGAVSLLAGAFVVTPSRSDVLGPVVTCSYDQPAAAVTAGTLRIALSADEPLSTQPLVSIDRPGTGNDVVLSPAVRGADASLWTLSYVVLPADGAAVLDGDCRITVSQARDLAGNNLRGLLNSTFTVDTLPPTSTLSYGKPSAAVGPGNLLITASFSEPLAGPPRLAVSRPGPWTDLVFAAMTPGADASVFTFLYTVAAADGVRVLDGRARVLLDGVVDRAGNAGLAPANDSFVIDTTPPIIALKPRLGTRAAPVGVLPIDLTASKPLSSAPRLTIERPGTGGDVQDAPMSPASDPTAWTFNYIVLPDDGSRVLDGTAVLSAAGILDLAGNAPAAPVVTLLPIDTVPPTAAFSFSQPSQRVGAGPFTLTATFSEPLAQTPSVAIDRPGIGNDLPPTLMRRAGDSRVWTISEEVLRQDGVDVLDGLAAVDLRGAVDFAGNSALPPAGSVIVFDTGPAPPVARLSFSSLALSRVPAGTLRVTASFNVPPPGQPLRMIRTLPGGAFAASGTALLELTATPDPQVFLADIALPVADGVNLFDGLQTLQLTFSDGKPVRTLGGKFRSLTLDSQGMAHVALELPRGTSLVSLPVAATGSGPGQAYMASDLARDCAAALVARTALTGSLPASKFEVFIPAFGRTDFALAGNRCYLVRLLAPATLRLRGPLWPAAQVDTTLAQGPNLLALPFGCPAAYAAADLLRDTGVSGVLRQRRAPDGSLGFEPFFGSGVSNFALGLEDGLLVLSPRTSSAALPAGP
ncbi:MAG: matrixin family metalloprotease [Candidatus Wallbacteria bacterium]|nr:matrixin family metalloprotease [Candidatus Wallbacteria bacterium]